MYKGVPLWATTKTRVPQTAYVRNKNKRVIDEMTRVDQSGATAADVDDVTLPPTNRSGPSPPVNLD